MASKKQMELQKRMRAMSGKPETPSRMKRIRKRNYLKEMLSGK